MKTNYISYYRNKNGHEYYSVRIKGKRKTFAFSQYGGEKKALKQAIKWRDAVLLDDRNITITNTIKQADYTVAYAYGRSLELYVHNPTTRRRHDAIFNAHFGAYAGKPLASIKPKDLLEHYNGLIDQPQNTINRVRSLWVQIFKAGIMDENIATNFADVVDVPKSQAVHVERRKFADADEVTLTLFLKVQKMPIKPERFYIDFLTGGQIGGQFKRIMVVDVAIFSSYFVAPPFLYLYDRSLV